MADSSSSSDEDLAEFAVAAASAANALSITQVAPAMNPDEFPNEFWDSVIHRHLSFEIGSASLNLLPQKPPEPELEEFLELPKSPQSPQSANTSPDAPPALNLNVSDPIQIPESQLPLLDAGTYVPEVIALPTGPSGVNRHSEKSAPTRGRKHRKRFAAKLAAALEEELVREATPHSPDPDDSGMFTNDHFNVQQHGHLGSHSNSSESTRTQRLHDLHSVDHAGASEEGMQRSNSGSMLMFDLSMDNVAAPCFASLPATAPESHIAPEVHEQQPAAQSAEGSPAERSASSSTAGVPIRSMDSGFSFLDMVRGDVRSGYEQKRVRQNCRLCGREVPVARLLAHSKVCKISSRYEKVISRADKELKELEHALVQGKNTDAGNLCAVARSILPAEPGALHRIKRLRARLAQLSKQSGQVDTLEPILHAVEEKIRSIKGMDNLQWRQSKATPGTDGTQEVISIAGQQRADALEGSKYTKWIYQTLCREDYFENGVPASERRHIGTTRRIQYIKQRYRLVRESAVEMLGTLDQSTDTFASRRKLRDDVDQQTSGRWSLMKAQFRTAGLVGQGSAGVVHRVVRLCDGEQFALKLFRGESMMRRAIKEARVMRACTGHRNVLALHCAMLGDEQQPALMMELADTDLFDEVLATGGLRQLRAKNLFRDLLLGLQHLHSECRIAHRDLKLENLLLVNGRLKIADFDLCSLASSSESVQESWISRSPCGTVAYASPELLAAGTTGVGYDPCISDLWAVGVCLYAMVTAELPFAMPTVKCPEFVRLQEGRFDWPNQFGAHLSGICSSLLTEDPTSRGTIEYCLNHEWLAE